MDYGDKPNNQYIIIWDQMNARERIFADISCTLMYQRMIRVVRVVKSMDVQKKEGGLREKEKRDRLDFFRDTVTTKYHDLKLFLTV